MKTLKLTIIASLLFLVSCATTNSAPTFKAPAANQSYAVLKTNAQPFPAALASAVAFGALAAVAIIPSSSYTMSINKIDGFAVKGSEQDLIRVSPGKHNVQVYCTLATGQGCGSKYLTVQAVAGKTYLITLVPPASGVDFGAARTAYIKQM